MIKLFKRTLKITGITIFLLFGWMVAGVLLACLCEWIGTFLRRISPIEEIDFYINMGIGFVSLITVVFIGSFLFVVWDKYWNRGKAW